MVSGSPSAPPIINPNAGACKAVRFYHGRDPGGARLGWLIDPLERKVYVYRPGSEVEVLDAPEEIAGDPVLHGFTLRLTEIW